MPFIASHSSSSPIPRIHDYEYGLLNKGVYMDMDKFWSVIVRCTIEGVYHILSPKWLLENFETATIYSGFSYCLERTSNYC